jgi:3-oxoadipate enol-lactonase
MATAQIGDVELYFETQGNGEPVLLVPPSWWPCATWNIGVVPSLRQRYQTIIFDCRGTGRSAKPQDGYTVTQLADDCIALLTHLQILRCHAVGFAMGSQIVQAMAIENPEQIATLTMAASGPGAQTLAGAQRIQRSLSSADREIREMGFESYIRSHVDNDGMAFNPSFYREHRDVASNLSDALWSGQSTLEQFHLHEDARLTWKPLEQASRVTVPTLILCGEDDKVERRGGTPAGTAEKLAERTPGAELALIPGTRHMTFWDGTGSLEALRNFLSRHPLA